MESRVYPTDTTLLPDESKWPHGYLGTVIAELLEKFDDNQQEVHRLTGVPSNTIWRVHDKMMNQGFDWRDKRKKLERRYRRSQAVKRKKGRPPKEVVFADGQELKLTETEPAQGKTEVIKPHFEVGDEDYTEEDEAPARGGNGSKHDKEPYVPGKDVPGVGLQTRRPVVTFKVSNHEIPVDPDGLFEMYFIFLDIKRRTGCEEDFMETLHFAMETLWHLSSPDLPMPQIQAEAEAEVELPFEEAVAA